MGNTMVRTREEGTVSRPLSPRGVVDEVEPEDKTSSCDRVVEQVTRGILSGRYVAGQKLIEADLTSELNISRGPVREALKRLAAEGVVALTPHRGAYIRALSRVEIAELLVVTELLAGLMARQAAERIAVTVDPATIGPAYERLYLYKEGRESGLDLLDQRRHFYETLIEIGGNAQLQAIMPTMRLHLLRQQIQSFQTSADRQRRLDEYAAVTRAVLNGDAKTAERKIRDHIKRMRGVIAAMPDGAFPSPK
jgi:DNA-binding GntR family transcriptional regulator